jgi:hypothetical protein
LQNSNCGFKKWFKTALEKIKACERAAIFNYLGFHKKEKQEAKHIDLSENKFKKALKKVIIDSCYAASAAE